MKCRVDGYKQVLIEGLKGRKWLCNCPVIVAKGHSGAIHTGICQSGVARCLSEPNKILLLRTARRKKDHHADD